MNSDNDIVTRLRRVPEQVPKGGMTVGPNIFYQRCQEAADEIERLRKALALAIGELSTHDTHRLYSPEQLYQEFFKEAASHD